MRKTTAAEMRAKEKKRALYFTIKCVTFKRTGIRKDGKQWFVTVKNTTKTGQDAFREIEFIKLEKIIKNAVQKM